MLGLNWVHLSIIRSVLVVIVFLIQKYERTNSLIFPNLLSIAIGIISAIYIMFSRDIEDIYKVSITKVILTAIITFIVIATTYYAIKGAPNPGLVRAFVGLEILILFVIGYFFMNTSISIYQLIGSVLVIIGLLMMEAS